MRNLVHKWPHSGHFFQKVGHFFQFWKRAGETYPILITPLITRMRGTENIWCLTQLQFFYKKPVYSKLSTKTSENQEVCGMLKYGVKLFTLCLLLSALNSLPFTCCYGKSKSINNPTNMSIIKCFPKVLMSNFSVKSF